VEFSRSIIEIIKERSSRRSYTPQPVEAEKLGALRDFFVALKGPFGGGARFVILDTTGWGEGKINALGTYGTIQGARLFIVGIIRRGEHDMEDFGCQFEKIILRATDLGLGTCWIGGIFNRSRFADKAGVREDEVLPAISSLGYAAQKRSVADSIVRWSAGSRNRRPWHQLFFHGSFEMALPTGAAGATPIPWRCSGWAPPPPTGSPGAWSKSRGGTSFTSTCAAREGTTSSSRPWTSSASTWASP